MPTRVLLEGPAIEPLLAQVREEYGSGVRIISADKVRSGGFGGFFARQHYELSVEVPDETKDRTEMTRNRSAGETAPQTLEQLLERAGERDAIPHPGDDTSAKGHSQGRQAGINDAVAAVGGLTPGTGPAPGIGLRPEPDHISDSSAAFAELMAGLDNANAIAAASAPSAKKPARRFDKPESTNGGSETGNVRPFQPAVATGSPVNGSSPLKPLPPVPSLAELMGGLGLAEMATPTPVDGGADRAPARPTRSAAAAAAYGVTLPELPRPVSPAIGGGPAAAGKTADDAADGQPLDGPAPADELLDGHRAGNPTLNGPRAGNQPLDGPAAGNQPLDGPAAGNQPLDGPGAGNQPLDSITTDQPTGSTPGADDSAAAAPSATAAAPAAAEPPPVKVAAPLPGTALAPSATTPAGKPPTAAPEVSSSIVTSSVVTRPAPANAIAVAAAPMVPAAVRQDDHVVVNLLRVGMPPALAATISGGDTYAGVLTALASRPAAPAIPDGAGEILVLVGELPHALAAARQCLEQIGLDQTHLLLAGPSAAGTGIHSSKVIPGPEDAARRTEKLHTADSAWVVAMDAPVGATDSAWVRQTCDAIGATAVWAVVDATRKTSDTARHLKLLGEVEALVVHGVDNTSDPATVLGLELPIVSLDGKPATPHAWAAMLCARIATEVCPVPAATRRPVRSR